MTEQDMIMYCPKCGEETPHLVSGTGRKATCEICGNETRRTTTVEIPRPEPRSGRPVTLRLTPREIGFIRASIKEMNPERLGERERLLASSIRRKFEDGMKPRLRR